MNVLLLQCHVLLLHLVDFVTNMLHLLDLRLDCSLISGWILRHPHAADHVQLIVIGPRL